MFKKIFSVFLTLCLVLIPFSTIYVSAAAIPEQGIMPLYNNTSSANCAMSINDSGKMTISYRVYGYSSSTTKIVINTYIEKKIAGVLWSRVDIGETNDEWTDTINKTSYIGSRTYQLSSTGTYRVKVTYTVYGTGGTADVIPFTIEKTY